MNFKQDQSHVGLLNSGSFEKLKYILGDLWWSLLTTDNQNVASCKYLRPQPITKTRTAGRLLPFTSLYTGHTSLTDKANTPCQRYCTRWLQTKICKGCGGHYGTFFCIKPVHPRIKHRANHFESTIRNATQTPCATVTRSHVAWDRQKRCIAVHADMQPSVLSVTPLQEAHLIIKKWMSTRTRLFCLSCCLSKCWS